MPATHIHLLVIQHGLWGETKHVAQLAKEAAERCATDKTPSTSFKYDAPPLRSMRRQNSIGIEHEDVKLVVYSLESNKGTQTYDGIELCAERACAEIDAEIERIEESGEGVVKRFSIVGYSLGGLIARYIIGILHCRSPSFFDSVRPVNFALFAAPSIGVTRARGAFGGFKHFAGGRLLSRTGAQVHGVDRFQGDKTLTEVMALPSSSFYQALCLFERIELYANVAKDRQISYSAGILEVHDPFAAALDRANKARAEAGISDEDPCRDLREGGLEIETDPKCPALITSFEPCEPIAPTRSADATDKPVRIVPRFLRPSSYPFWPPALRWAVVLTFPIAMPLFLCLAIGIFSYQSSKSRRRIKLLQKKVGLEHRHARLSRVGLKEKMDEAVEATLTPASEGELVKLDGDDPLWPHDALLTPAQRRMIKHLNAIPQLRKHFVFFPDGLNGHAQIICRDPLAYPSHEDGRPVLRHFCEGFRL